MLGIQGGVGERRGPSSLYVFAIPKPGHGKEQIRATIVGEIERLAGEGPTAEEMEKLRNNLLNDATRGRQSSMYRAQRLAEYTLYDGDPHLFNTELEQYLNVTAEQIREAAARYLLTDNFSLVEIVPSAEEVAAEDSEAATPASPVTANAPEQPARRRRRCRAPPTDGTANDCPPNPSNTPNRVPKNPTTADAPQMKG